MATTAERNDLPITGNTSFETTQNISMETDSMVDGSHALPASTGLDDSFERASSSEEDPLQRFAISAGSALGSARRSVEDAYESAMAQAQACYSRTMQKTRELSRAAQQSAETMKQQHPLRLLGIVAGTAFATGVVIRLWRERNS